MFALEIEFHDGVSSPETLLIRRPHAVVGTSDYAHVVIEGAASSLCELRLTRGLGREFFCQALRKEDHHQPPFIEGSYSKSAEVPLGEVTTTVTPLDVDLMMQADESPDRAGVRVLREALAATSPVFPAVSVLGMIPLFVSFRGDQSLLIGRSRECGLRLESSEVSSQHARMGFQDGRFWVEDLGSTNGTFVGSERVSGRRVLDTQDVVRIGVETKVAGVATPEDLERINRGAVRESGPIVRKPRFPCIRSASEIVKPQRYVVNPGSSLSVGRDPASDIWVGAAHISRQHALIEGDRDGSIWITDTSSNGCFIAGERLKKGERRKLPKESLGLNLGEGVDIMFCYSEEDERSSIDAANSSANEMSSASVPEPARTDATQSVSAELSSFAESSTLAEHARSNVSTSSLVGSLEGDRGEQNSETDLQEDFSPEPEGVFRRLFIHGKPSVKTAGDNDSNGMSINAEPDLGDTADLEREIYGDDRIGLNYGSRVSLSQKLLVLFFVGMLIVVFLIFGSLILS